MRHGRKDEEARRRTRSARAYVRLLQQAAHARRSTNILRVNTCKCEHRNTSATKIFLSLSTKTFSDNYINTTVCGFEQRAKKKEFRVLVFGGPAGGAISSRKGVRSGDKKEARASAVLYLDDAERPSLRQLRFQLFAFGREVNDRALRGLWHRVEQGRVGVG